MAVVLHLLRLCERGLLSAGQLVALPSLPFCPHSGACLPATLFHLSTGIVLSTVWGTSLSPSLGLQGRVKGHGSRRLLFGPRQRRWDWSLHKSAGALLPRVTVACHTGCPRSHAASARHQSGNCVSRVGAL